MDRADLQQMYCSVFGAHLPTQIAHLTETGNVSPRSYMEIRAFHLSRSAVPCQGRKDEAPHRSSYSGSSQRRLFVSFLRRCSSGAKPGMPKARREKRDTAFSIRLSQPSCRWPRSFRCTASWTLFGSRPRIGIRILPDSRRSRPRRVHSFRCELLCFGALRARDFMA
jgi:hypothetical protein